MSAPLDPADLDPTPDTVAEVADAINAGTLDVAAAEAALREITPTSSLPAPARDVDELYRRESDDSWLGASDDNNPNRLFFIKNLSYETFVRLREALLGPSEPSQ